MESRISEVGRTITKIGKQDLNMYIYLLRYASEGEQLESIHLSRQRAQAAHDLIDYYFLFAKNDTAKLDELRKEGRDGRQQVAVLLRRLKLVATEVDIPSAEKVASVLYNKLTCSPYINRLEKISTNTVRNSKRTPSGYSTSATVRATQK